MALCQQTSFLSPAQASTRVDGPDKSMDLGSTSPRTQMFQLATREEDSTCWCADSHWAYSPPHQKTRMVITSGCQAMVIMSSRSPTRFYPSTLSNSGMNLSIATVAMSCAISWSLHCQPVIQPKWRTRLFRCRASNALASCPERLQLCCGWDFCMLTYLMTVFAKMSTISSKSMPQPTWMEARSRLSRAITRRLMSF